MYGVLASEQNWLSFEHAWLAALENDGLTHFHMEDCVKWQGEFSTWDRNEPRRKRLLKRLIKIVKNTVDQTFLTGFHLRHYHLLDETYCLTETVGGPYGLLADVAHFRVERWMQEHHPGEDWHHVFEAGDVGQGVLAEAIRKGAMEHASILPKKLKDGTRVRPFEAADMVVWEKRRVFEDYVDMDTRSSRPIRGSLLEMAEQLPRVGGFNRWVDIRSVVEESVPRRPCN
jgi:hypothetical protein